MSRLLMIHCARRKQSGRLKRVCPCSGQCSSAVAAHQAGLPSGTLAGWTPTCLRLILPLQSLLPPRLFLPPLQPWRKLPLRRTALPSKRPALLPLTAPSTARPNPGKSSRWRKRLRRRRLQRSRTELSATPTCWPEDLGPKWPFYPLSHYLKNRSLFVDFLFLQKNVNNIINEQVRQNLNKVSKNSPGFIIVSQLINKRRSSAYLFHLCLI